MDKQLIRIDEVSVMLSQCHATVYRLLQRDPRFPRPVKLGRSTRWHQSEIVEYAKNLART